MVTSLLMRYGYKNKKLRQNQYARHFGFVGCTIYDVGEEKSHFSLDGKCDGNSLASFLVS